VNEVSGSKCPELMQKLQADQATARLQKEAEPHSDSEMNKLREELRNFEATFYKEMSRLKDLNMTIKLQQDSIDSTQKYVKKKVLNATRFDLLIKNMDKKIVKQWTYIKDLESKVFEVMTSLGELNLMLEKRLPKLNDLDTKVIDVESAPKTKNCGLGKNTKYYRGEYFIFTSLFRP
jgi:chromosome segregation ATPase